MIKLNDLIIFCIPIFGMYLCLNTAHLRSVAMMFRLALFWTEGTKCGCFWCLSNKDFHGIVSTVMTLVVSSLCTRRIYKS